MIDYEHRFTLCIISYGTKTTDQVWCDRCSLPACLPVREERKDMFETSGFGVKIREIVEKERKDKENSTVRFALSQLISGNENAISFHAFFTGYNYD